jgi:tetratricopeptide (TPR) repeat protein
MWVKCGVMTSGLSIRSVSACTWFVWLLLLAMPATADTWVGDCGNFDEAISGFGGPFDYNDPGQAAQLELVERHHFTTEIATLQRGNLGPTIHYTLNRFPNHPRALDAMSRLSVRDGVAQPPGARYTADCYFERGIRWRPRDPNVRLVYAIHHHRLGRIDRAIEQARIGLELAPDHPEIHYNLGLFLVRKGDYAGAREHAERAYELGHPLQGLRNRLRRAGHWAD